MNGKKIFMVLLLLCAGTGAANAAQPGTLTITTETPSLRSFNFNDPIAAKYSVDVEQRKWCITHTIGLGVIVTGTTSLLVGAILIGSAPTRDKQGIFPTGQALTGLGMEAIGVIAAVAGTPVLIIGAIHDQRKGMRYGFVGPKGEMGVAYSF